MFLQWVSWSGQFKIYPDLTKIYDLLVSASERTLNTLVTFTFKLADGYPESK